MNSLERFGITAPNTTLSTHEIKSKLSPEEFNTRSQKLLAELAPVVLSEIVPHLEGYPARLHSSGFRVRVLGTHEQLGDLRFHEYHPDMNEKREPWGIGQIDTDPHGEPIFDAGIHNHAWGVSSRVIYGEPNENGERAGYADRMYEVRKADSADAAEALGRNGFFRLFETLYIPGQPVQLQTTNEIMQATPIIDRYVHVGEGHFIPPGAKEGEQWHVPFVPPRLVITLAFNSHRMLDAGPYVLIGGSQSHYTTERRPASPSETEEVKRKILQDTP